MSLVSYREDGTLGVESVSLEAIARRYGTMSSNYNSRPRPAEVGVDGAELYLARPRESIEGLFASERLLP